ncbi:hypothetical protein BLNAU_12979 [Blattamonas nauphoetae]|uniref:Uncharacterized protein n=1 Tax=Blattamonas nauphoetae TaxID=2049346 RepID=A0ABQ9XLB5_9EUKA|nr:hypothetical protein BLNAU_12979 [Blattamonas nauphoetae]
MSSSSIPINDLQTCVSYLSQRKYQEALELSEKLLAIDPHHKTLQNIRTELLKHIEEDKEKVESESEEESESQNEETAPHSEQEALNSQTDASLDELSQEEQMDDNSQGDYNEIPQTRHPIVQKLVDDNLDSVSPQNDGTLSNDLKEKLNSILLNDIASIRAFLDDASKAEESTSMEKANALRNIQSELGKVTPPK